MLMIKTWHREGIKVAKLFYFFVQELVKNNQIDKEEIEKLKTGEYTKKLFVNTNYPAIADSRDAYMGNSKVKRYRSNPIKFENTNIFITTQFYESDRDEVIRWYEEHKQS